MLTIVVGAQFGGEGKGKISAYLASRGRFAAACRCGGVNSSHTVVQGTTTVRLRLMPAAALADNAGYYIFGAGTLLHVPTLFSEIELLKIDHAKIIIDPQAGIVTEDCVKEQRKDPRYIEIGSTLTGTGQASARRCLRSLSLAKDIAELRNFIGDVPLFLYDLIKRKKRDVLIEGQQGFGLSNYHGDYPYTSSRDSTAAAMLSELGLGPRLRMRIILAVKAFPTRNHGGRLDHEVSEEEASRYGIAEFGGGSWGIKDKRRRVGIVNFADIARAAKINSATEIALTGAVYLDPSVRGVTSVSQMSGYVREFVSTLEKATGIPVRYVSTGPDTGDMVDVRDAYSDMRASISGPDLFH